MRIALISDVHGNLVALEAVLADLARDRIEKICCLGDVVATGPHPREVLNRIRALGCPMIMGNTELELLEGEAEEHRWHRARLFPEDLAYIRSFRQTLEVPLAPNLSLLCFHGSPRSPVDLITWATSAADLDGMLHGASASLLAGGHTHIQMVRAHRDRLIVNPGSVGLAYDQNAWTGEVPQDRVRIAPWAGYAVVWYEQGRQGVELRRVPVDVQAVVRSVRDSGMPNAAWWLKLLRDVARPGL